MAYRYLDRVFSGGGAHVPARSVCIDSVVTPFLSEERLVTLSPFECKKQKKLYEAVQIGRTWI